MPFLKNGDDNDDNNNNDDDDDDDDDNNNHRVIGLRKLAKASAAQKTI